MEVTGLCKINDGLINVIEECKLIIINVVVLFLKIRILEIIYKCNTVFVIFQRDFEWILIN